MRVDVRIHVFEPARARALRLRRLVAKAGEIPWRFARGEKRIHLSF